jgi:hypothetical protein
VLIGYGKKTPPEKVKFQPNSATFAKGGKKQV